MRRDGDRLLDLLASAEQTVLLCAPFIKVGVLSNLLRAVQPQVQVEVVTRWLPAEVAVGVSDLAVFDLLRARPNSRLRLLDRLHAKLYQADGRVLAGSANLTGAALGWSETPNLELLTDLDDQDAAVVHLRAALAAAREATEAERDRVAADAAALQVPRLDLEQDVAEGAGPGVWLPRFGAPQRLIQAYMPRLRDRLPSSMLSAADADLRALALAEGLDEAAFKSAVAEAVAAMPAIERILAAAADDLTDEDGVRIIGELTLDQDLTADAQWLIVREWLTFFLNDRYEIAPRSFVVRLRPGAAVR